MDEWLPLAGVFLVVTGLLLGLYLLFRRRPQPDRLRAADLDGDEPPRPAVFGKLTSPLAEQLPPRPAVRAELVQELRSAGFYRPTALTDYLAVRTVLVLLPVIAAGLLALLVEPAL